MRFAVQQNVVTQTLSLKNRDQHKINRQVSYTVRGGILRTARPSMIHDQPLKIKSMPRNKPITQKAASGNCRQIMMPSRNVIMPLTRAQPHPEKRWLIAMIMRKSPPATKNNDQR